MLVCALVCVCMHVCVHACMCISVCMHVCMHACVCGGAQDDIKCLPQSSSTSLSETRSLTMELAKGSSVSEMRDIFSPILLFHLCAKIQTLGSLRFCDKHFTTCTVPFFNILSVAILWFEGHGLKPQVWLRLGLFLGIPDCAEAGSLGLEFPYDSALRKDWVSLQLPRNPTALCSWPGSQPFLLFVNLSDSSHMAYRNAQNFMWCLLVWDE